MQTLLLNPYFHVLVPVLAAFLMNTFIYLIPGFYRSVPIKGLPPGYVIGIIWMIIFALLGYAHYLLYMKKRALTSGCIALELLLVFSILYPVFTGLNPKSGLIYNLLSLVLAFVTGIVVVQESRTALAYLVPYLLWVFYVNAFFVLKCSGN